MKHKWIKQLTESDSRLHKEDVLKRALDAGDHVFLNGIRNCYNPYITFGVKQIPATEGITGAPNPYEEFDELLTRLSARQLTGHAARDAILGMSLKFDSDEWNLFLAPILRRDMRAGFSDRTINKVCKGTEYVIPTFGCQLAANSEGRPEMVGTKWLEPKLDGARVLLIVSEGNTATCYSRNGKVFDNFQHVEQQVLSNVYAIRAYLKTKGGFVLDGEIMGKSFQDLMRQAQRKENVQTQDTVFNVFDILPLEDFKRGFWNAQLRKRLAILTDMQPVFDAMPNVTRVDSQIVVDLSTEEGRTKLQDYATEMVTAGFEGIMIKDMEAPYECKRNTFWMKWKPTITVDLPAIELEEGTGRNKGRLGALVCRGVDHGKEISVNVGSGFSDTERDLFWKQQELIVGRTAEILCDVITQNQDGTYSLRFPRFVRWRDDK
jgi:DNA ligase-1